MRIRTSATTAAIAAGDVISTTVADANADAITTTTAIARKTSDSVQNEHVTY